MAIAIVILPPGASRRLWRALKSADDSGKVLARHGQVVVLTDGDLAAELSRSAARFGRVVLIAVKQNSISATEVNDVPRN